MFKTKLKLLIYIIFCYLVNCLIFRDYVKKDRRKKGWVVV